MTEEKNKPYKQNIIDKAIADAQDDGNDTEYEEVVKVLQRMGVAVYQIGYQSTTKGGDLFGDITAVATDVSNKLRDDGLKERCLLYKDRDGRPFNLTITGGSSGLNGAWTGSSAVFSGISALIACVALARYFACPAYFDDGATAFKPIFLTLFLGLVLSEEASYSHLSVAMWIWGCPSVSAYELLSGAKVDWPYKLMTFFLSISTSFTTQRFTNWGSFIGVALAFCIFAANLGARAWNNLKLKPLQYNGPFNLVLASIIAIPFGLAVPYLGFRSILAGHQAYKNYIIVGSAFVVGSFFILSDINDFQSVVIPGSQDCDQTAINAVVGIWWGISVILSLIFVRRITNTVITTDSVDTSNHPVLVAAADSPVGFKVSNIADFPVNETLSAQAKQYVSVNMIRLTGLILVCGGIAAIEYLAWVGFDGF